jgi:isopentenyldiphosphate isomerase
MSETVFLNHLREEKIKTQDVRGAYVDKKLSYATALLGVGSLGVNVTQIGLIGNLNLGLLLYLVPWVTIAFDLYILAEDYSVKRIGAFLSHHSNDPTEKAWETWVSKNRDPFAPFAMPILTTLLLVGSSIMIWLSGNLIKGSVFWIWVSLTALTTWGLFGYYKFLRRKAKKRIVASVPQYKSEQVTYIEKLIGFVERYDNVLNIQTYTHLKDLFLEAKNDPSVMEMLSQASPEYGKPEFLLCVDANGAPCQLDKEILEDFRSTTQQFPDFSNWLQEASFEADGEATLLIARWLCHLSGFRHRSVHLFIDHPSVPEYSLIQVRSLEKSESPSKFDIPVAGHVLNTLSVLEALFNEMNEELALKKEDVWDLKQIGVYDYSGFDHGDKIRNQEYRYVFRCRIKPETLSQIRLGSKEVAAFAIFSLAELVILTERKPERIASGLKNSLSIYLAAHA